MTSATEKRTKEPRRVTARGVSERLLNKPLKVSSGDYQHGRGRIVEIDAANKWLSIKIDAGYYIEAPLRELDKDLKLTGR
jgi:hypothetical protein